MNKKYQWETAHDCLRLGLDEKDIRGMRIMQTAEYRNKSDTCSSDMKIYGGNELLAHAIVHKLTPNLVEFTAGRTFIERYFFVIKHSKRPENSRLSDDLAKMIQLIEINLLGMEEDTEKERLAA